MVLDSRVCSLKFDLQGILNEGDLVDPSIKQIRILDRIEISQVIHCNGLLLCVFEDNRNLMVWNPYLGQKRLIRRPRKVSSQDDLFAFGYDNNNKNCNHKILRILEKWDDFNKGDFPYSFKLYDFNSDSWRRVLDVKPEFFIDIYQCPVSLKGNTYFVAGDIITDDVEKDFLLCFDFIGPLLPMPYNFVADTVKLSCVGEEKLAVLYQKEKTMEIWITTKVLPNAVSWRKFLKVDITSQFNHWSFFIDEEKKVAIVFYKYYERKPTKSGWYQGAYIIGEDGDFKFVNLGEAWQHVIYTPYAFSSYAPSLVQLQFNQRGKRKVKCCPYSKIKKDERSD